MCIAVTVLGTAKYHRNLICNDGGWDGNQESVNGGFQTMVRVWSAEQIPASQLNLKFTSVLPQFCLFKTSLLPHLDLCSAGNLEPRLGNLGLQTLGARKDPLLGVCPPVL